MTRTMTRIALRRGVWVLVSICLLVAGLLAIPLQAQAAEDSGVHWAPNQQRLDDPDIGSTGVYFSDTGHSLSGGFLQFWHRYGGAALFGDPISQPIYAVATNETSQYFQQAVFSGPGTSPTMEQIQIARTGEQLLSTVLLSYRDMGNRFQAIATANGLSYQPGDPAAPIEPVTDGSDQFFSQTGHSLTGALDQFWQANGGLFVFGYPLTQPFVDPSSGLTKQVFERAVMQQATGSPVSLEPLGELAATAGGVATAPVSRPAGDVTDSSNIGDVTPPPGAPVDQAKWIEVDLTTQTLRAWHYNQRVFGSYASTGLPGSETPTGTFHIFAKFDQQDMQGCRTGPDDCYYMPSVPWVMYFADGGYAIHAAYWHNAFGKVMSAGCVNLPILNAEWLYDWTPMNTVVWVHK